MAIDRVRMRNRLNFDVWNAMSKTPYATDYDQRNGTQGVFVELFINGQYHGLYCCSDKVNRKLLGVKKVKNDDGNATIRGVIYKGAQWCEATKLNGYDDSPMTGPMWNNWELEYPDDYPCAEAYTPLKDFIDYCTTTTNEELAAGINDQFYWHNFVDYCVLLLSQGLLDNHLKNSFLSIVNINKKRCFMLTPWDLDASLGGTYSGAYYPSAADTQRLLEVSLFRRMWENDLNGFTTAIANRWRMLHTAVLSEQAFNDRVDAYAHSFIESGAWEREYLMWNGNPVPLAQDLNEETAYIKDWYHKNCANLEQHIFKGIASGITEQVCTTSPDATATYNLQGQKVDASYKGIVITNGRKMIRR